MRFGWITSTEHKDALDAKDKEISRLKDMLGPTHKDIEEIRCQVEKLTNRVNRMDDPTKTVLKQPEMRQINIKVDGRSNQRERFAKYSSQDLVAYTDKLRDGMLYTDSKVKRDALDSEVDLVAEEMTRRAGGKP